MWVSRTMNRFYAPLQFYKKRVVKIYISNTVRVFIIHTNCVRDRRETVNRLQIEVRDVGTGRFSEDRNGAVGLEDHFLRDAAEDRFADR